MSKNKKDNHNQPGSQGMFYAQRKCKCGKLIVGSSPKSYRAANSDLGQRLKVHQEEHEKEKEGTQLDLSIQGIEENHSESIERITLRGEKKS